MKQLSVFLISILTVLTALAQTGSISGKLQDSASRKALAFATVTVFKASDTAIITYRLSNPEGDFKIPGLPFDVKCRVLVSYSGYIGYRKEFTVRSDQPVLDLGTVYMSPA